VDQLVALGQDRQPLADADADHITGGNPAEGGHALDFRLEGGVESDAEIEFLRHGV
jgi:hypothetical protein